MKSIKSLIPWRRGHPAVRSGWDAPGSMLEDFHRRMNQLFDDFFRGSALPAWPSESLFRREELPRFEVAETDAAVEVTAELPGLDEKDIEVTVDGQLLRVSGEKKAEHDTRKKSYHLREVSYGRFERVVALPAEVEADKAKAVFKKGVLHLTLPKSAAEHERRKRIAISSG